MTCISWSNNFVMFCIILLHFWLIVWPIIIKSREHFLPHWVSNFMTVNYISPSDNSESLSIFAWKNSTEDVQEKPQLHIIAYQGHHCRPRWLSWMRRPTGDQEVAGSTPAEVGNILSWRLIMKYFLRSFSPFRWFKKGSCQFLAKECAQYWLTA